jgi:RNA polymerase sigma factor for flagellar operon FliA
VRLSTTPVDPETRDRLVLAHVSLVKILAQRLAHRLPPSVELNELMSVGVLGLVEAANRYQPALGVPFDAFARRRIHGAMLDALRNLDWVPRSVRRLRRELDGAVARLRQELGHEPEEAEIAEAMQLTPAQFDKAVEELRAVEVASIRALDALGPDGESLLNVAVDPGESPAAEFERGELREQLARAIDVLPERERQILALSYEEELTLAEIGQVLGVSESRVCQLRSLALSRLRAALSHPGPLRSAPAKSPGSDKRSTLSSQVRTDVRRQVQEGRWQR